MLSGGGRTLGNLHSAIARGAFNATIALVIGSKECIGTARARDLGITTVVHEGRFDRERLGTLLSAHRIDLVALAGYLKLLPIPAGFEGRIVNIHPALLPAFGGPGMHGKRVHEAVLAAGASQSGCTVHLCDDRYDTGPIVLQRSCPVLPGDTPDSLAERVFEQECLAYPQALTQLIGGLVRIEGGVPNTAPLA